MLFRSEGRVLEIRPGQEAGLERDHHDLHVPLAELLFLLTQLREVRPAGESPEVAMEHHQEPAAPVIFEEMTSAVALLEPERNGRSPRQIIHDRFPRAWDASRFSSSPSSAFDPDGRNGTVSSPGGKDPVSRPAGRRGKPPSGS